jgi:ABC-type transport system involved in multi-copper enzyme maturation permease subunit
MTSLSSRPRSVLLWLARETWLQARASRLSFLMLLGSGLVIALCLSINIESPGPDHSTTPVELTDAQGNPITEPGHARGRISLAFGAIQLGIFRDSDAQAEFLRALLARWAAGAIGVLLALIATAGLLPEALRPESAVVLLTKPIPRASLLWGKALGVIAFVSAHATFFVAGTWVALGLRLGNWQPAYLVSLPILVVHFVVVFGVAVLLAVCTRSAVACTLGSVVFWCLCLASNQAHLGRAALVATDRETLITSTPMRWATQASYWILPKPLNLMIALDKAVHATRHFALSPEADRAIQDNTLRLGLTLSTSLIFAFVTLLVAGREFASLEY